MVKNRSTYSLWPVQDTDRENKNAEATQQEKEDSKMEGLETLGILALLIGIIGIGVLLKSRKKSH